MSTAPHTLGKRNRAPAPTRAIGTSLRSPQARPIASAPAVVTRVPATAVSRALPTKAPPTLGKRKPAPPVQTGTLGKRKTSPVIAPEVIPPDVGPETISPADTVPAADPYAPDASWSPFPDDDDSAGAMQELDDLPTAGMAVDIGPAVIENQDDSGASPAPSPPAAVSKPKLSWFDRILAWFGLARHKVSQAVIAGEAANMATMSQSEAAAQLVRRARNGDQNAMAMIACVRDAAASGNAKAILSAKFMREYILRNPVDESGSFGIEDVIPRKAPRPSDPSTAAAMALSHGPPLTNPRIGAFIKAAQFGEEEVKSFFHGFHGRKMRNPDEKIQKANQAGWLVAHARKLQLVRLPHTKIGKKFDANIGWELGEDIE